MFKRLATAAVSLSLTAFASAATVSVQFYGRTDCPLGPTEVAGAPGVAANHWNAIDAATKPASLSNLVDSGGNTVAMTAAITDGNGKFDSYGTPGTSDAKLLYSGLATRRDGRPISITLSDIPYEAYDLYIYVSGGDRPTVATQGSTSYYFRTTGADTTYTQATSTTAVDHTDWQSAPSANYVLFSGLSGASVTFDVAPVANSLSEQWGLQYWDIGLAGFQIVAVPEPGSLGSLTALTACALLRRRRQA